MDGALLAALREQQQPPWMAFFVGWAPPDRRSQGECLFLSNTHMFKGLGMWQRRPPGPTSSYIRIRLGTTADPANPVISYLHRLLAWANWGDKPGDVRTVQRTTERQEVAKAARIDDWRAKPGNKTKELPKRLQRRQAAADKVEADHTCGRPACVYAGHIRWVQHSINLTDGHDRRRGLAVGFGAVDGA